MNDLILINENRKRGRCITVNDGRVVEVDTEEVKKPKTVSRVTPVGVNTAGSIDLPEARGMVKCQKPPPLGVNCVFDFRLYLLDSPTAEDRGTPPEDLPTGRRERERERNLSPS